MILQISAKKLNDYVKKVIGCVADKSSMMILSNIILKASNSNQITLKATNLEIGMQIDLSMGSLEGECEVAINGKRFADILAGFKGDDIIISILDSQVEIKSVTKKSGYKLPFLSIDEFPKIEFPNWEQIQSEKKEIEIDNFELKSILSSVVYACSIDDARYFLQGVYIEKHEDGIRFVATDGKRLSLNRFQTEKEINLDLGYIIPRSIIMQVIQSISDEGVSYITFDDNKVYFKSDVFQFSSNLLEGKYPDYKRIIPNDHEFSVVVKVQDLLDGVSGSVKILDKKCNRLTVCLTNNTMKLIAINPDTGEYEDEIAVKGSEVPANFEIDFSYQFMIDVCNVQSESEIELQIRDFDKAVIVNPVLENGKRFDIIMPLNRRSESGENSQEGSDDN